MKESSPPVSIEEARQRLRELGYLDGRVERFVFRRALEGRGGLLLPALVIGALAAAIASTAAVAGAEPGFGASLASVAALAVHLFFADLLPAAIGALLVALWAGRSRSPSGAATAVALAGAGLVFALWIGGVWGLAHEIAPPALLWGVPVALMALLLARSVRTGFLAHAYARSSVLPTHPRRKVLLATVVAGVIAAVAILSSRTGPKAAPAPKPSPRTGAVVVVAVDGLGLDSEPERWTGLRELLGRGRSAWWPARVGPPPQIWADLATGVDSARHGVRALERVRPRGSPFSLRPPLGTAWYLRGVGIRLALVATAPVSSADRKSLAFWEVAASSGLPTLAVGWWASGSWPGADVIGNEEILTHAADGISADREAIAVFRGRRSDAMLLQTLYLPGPDILRGDSEKRPIAIDEIHRFLEDEVSRALSGPGALVVLAADSHPARESLGRMIVFDGGEPWTMLRGRPEDVAVSILARLGVPAANDLAGRLLTPLFRPGSLEASTVATYGPRIAPPSERSRATDREYLERLKSLGYLQ